MSPAHRPGRNPKSRRLTGRASRSPVTPPGPFSRAAISRKPRTLHRRVLRCLSPLRLRLSARLHRQHRQRLRPRLRVRPPRLLLRQARPLLKPSPLRAGLCRSPVLRLLWSARRRPRPRAPHRRLSQRRLQRLPRVLLQGRWSLSLPFRPPPRDPPPKPVLLWRRLWLLPWLLLRRLRPRLSRPHLSLRLRLACPKLLLPLHRLLRPSKLHRRLHPHRLRVA